MRAAISLVLPEHLVAHYEVLRANALGTVPTAGLGWTLFLHQGMLAWSQAWQAVAAPPSTPAPLPSPSTPVLGVDPEVVCILAGMVLAVHQEVSYGD